MVPCAPLCCRARCLGVPRCCRHRHCIFANRPDAGTSPTCVGWWHSTVVRPSPHIKSCTRSTVPVRRDKYALFSLHIYEHRPRGSIQLRCSYSRALKAEQYRGHHVVRGGACVCVHPRGAYRHVRTTNSKERTADRAVQLWQRGWFLYPIVRRPQPQRTSRAPESSRRPA